MTHVFDDSARASEDVLAFNGMSAPRAAPTPGFSLIDDCDGRFVIDSVTGFISVASEDIVTRDHGGTFEARMRVVEKSGGSYDMPVRLVITGLVPQMAGAESFGEFSIEQDAPPAPRQSAPVVEAPCAAPTITEEPLPFSLARWNSFQAFAAQAPQHRQRGRLAHAPYGALAPATPANLECPSAVLTVPAPAFNYPG